MNRAKRILFHILFWGVATLFLALFLRGEKVNFSFAIGFVLLLIPGAMVTSYLFNYVLIPKYLLTNRYWKFALYGYLVAVVSLLIEMGIVISFFVIQADYDYQNMNSVTTNLINLGVGLYFVIFLSALIFLIKRWSQPDTEQPKPTLQFRSDRKNVRLELEQVKYIESMDNYVKVHAEDEVFVTKEKISALAERTDEWFIRIHRAFLINPDFVVKYSRESVTIGESDLPISRTYKKAVLERLAS